MRGVLLVLHGSKVDEWKEVATKYSGLLSKYFDHVEYGFIEFNKPTLKESAEKLGREGVDEIVAVPLLFAAGAHFYRDIPKLLGLDEDGTILVNGRKIKVIIARPIGVDPRVAEILKERVEEAYESTKSVS
ncbi:MAG: sirohydrochlorin cobaltochelatase [Candidatus Aramenus sulfurataquae]|jgi:sirohydrochlorin cobaltochelatase|uniref:Sirohydrochlorin cobaltochelatase n=2 Tax=Candidatus Aramenus sulfurataquae TaxID=1326980 RepID=W7KZR5_9CREN|nr:MAG: sirohydrochlorin cobaltochelatase [Candidatus Aramenus sulfurataquae]MCL7343467.1 sirohydrochlorin nickelochelatase [Candidatus Aramenus sulfurataquae]